MIRKTYTAIEARQQLAELINQAVYAGQPALITRSGKNVAVLISYDQYQAFQQLLASQSAQAATLPPDNESGQQEPDQQDI